MRVLLSDIGILYPLGGEMSSKKHETTKKTACSFYQTSGLRNCKSLFPVLSDLLYVKRRTAKKPFSMCHFFCLVSGFCRLYKRKGFHCQGTEESIFLLLGNGSGGKTHRFAPGYSVPLSNIPHDSVFFFLGRNQSFALWKWFNHFPTSLRHFWRNFFRP